MHGRETESLGIRRNDLPRPLVGTRSISVVERRVEHDVADLVDALFLHALAPEVRGRAGRRAEKPLRNAVG